MKVVIISKADCAGSGQRFAEALRSMGHDATMVAFARNAYGYPLDMLGHLANLQPVQDLIDAADVVHLKGDHLPSDHHGLNFGRKPIAITAGGSGFRRRTSYSAQPWEQAWSPLQEYARQCHAIGVLTPDLMYPQLPATRWVPHATRITSTWQDPGPRTVLIGHSPSNPGVKGTEDVVLPAIKLVQSWGHNVQLMLIKGLSNAECLQRKSQCHLFIDQCIIPAYGLSGVEAMAMGIPVAQLLPPVAQRHPSIGAAVLGFTLSTPLALANALARALAPGELAKLHQATLNYCNRVHSFRAVARELHLLYDEAIKANAQKRRRADPGT